MIQCLYYKLDEYKEKVRQWDIAVNGCGAHWGDRAMTDLMIMQGIEEELAEVECALWASILSE